MTKHTHVQNQEILPTIFQIASPIMHTLNNFIIRTSINMSLYSFSSWDPKWPTKNMDIAKAPRSFSRYFLVIFHRNDFSSLRNYQSIKNDTGMVTLDQ